MSTIQATYRHGVFTPDEAIELSDGARVVIQYHLAESLGRTKIASTSPSPLDGPLESEEDGAPFDLPMPGVGEQVNARDDVLPLPDLPLTTE